ncbi:hypothetical protein [Wenyingzhuangia sp. 2_MG-2023]|uniref:hypothetical protein n=1 Tax=Wenyingzhuangia sp. 2_MG-2023 TaxID=3062639 RepID=UPI0026E15C16|nr:hypothetical protein [Wenyingzhuangia sp. 2_MG-2023]MDO6737104.1 hypothetical protein [Wenyingzhuangia sp. 2_MG-2023]
MKKITEKLYFRSIDHNVCYPLSHFIEEAKEEGLTEITLVQAIPDKDTKNIFWCSEHLETVEKSDCVKSYCDSYFSKSGRGPCSSRGKLYLHGEEETFKIAD